MPKKNRRVAEINRSIPPQVDGFYVAEPASARDMALMRRDQLIYGACYMDARGRHVPAADVDNYTIDPATGDRIYAPWRPFG